MEAFNKETTEKHVWNDEFCSCGQDVVTCQVCNKRVCGSLTSRKMVRGNESNVCAACSSWGFGTAVQKVQ